MGLVEVGGLWRVRGAVQENGAKGLTGKKIRKPRAEEQWECIPEVPTYLPEVSCNFTSKWLNQTWKYDCLLVSRCS